MIKTLTLNVTNMYSYILNSFKAYTMGFFDNKNHDPSFKTLYENSQNCFPPDI